MATPPSSVAITGATGFIGRHLVPHLRAAGQTVHPVMRDQTPLAGGLAWQPATGRLVGPWDGIGAVVHLAGEPIGHRWTRTRRRRILESRRDGTRRLCAALAHLPHPPRTLIVASAVGYYGDRADEWLTEASSRGDGFLADVCQAWEGAADPARAAGIRVVHLRQGLVLGRDGGALRRMLPVFRLGIAGRLGPGDQYWSWIAIEDLVRVYAFALRHERATGAINATAPLPVTNAEFTRTLGRVLRRPTPFPVPRLALRMIFGDMARETLLFSQRVAPQALVALGHTFLHSDVESALRAELHRPLRAAAPQTAQPSLRQA